MKALPVHTHSDHDGVARLTVDARRYEFPGHWIEGGPWERFGLYNTYVIVRDDGQVLSLPASAGELVPGSTEDLEHVLRRYDSAVGHPPAPMTLELDPTYRCASRDCGGRCFSAPYRKLSPQAEIPARIVGRLIDVFAADGGRVVRFDGGGDPLMHPAVRSGELVERAAAHGLKTTILTSGDLLSRTDLGRIAQTGCYLRVSVNAATDHTRRQFHDNGIALGGILDAIRQFVFLLDRERVAVPVGVTFLLDTLNFREVADCARICRGLGVGHFSVRRVLGPSGLRPAFTPDQLREAQELLTEVSEMNSRAFRTFVPWRPIPEPDLSPAEDDFSAARCWQSTFKVVVEPQVGGDGFRGQLCGRYRGGGIGQAMQLPPLFRSDTAGLWLDHWRESFREYPITREALPRTCTSCIDRGFIVMMDRLLHFLGSPSAEFTILHLHSTAPAAGESDLPTNAGWDVSAPEFGLLQLNLPKRVG